MKRMRAGIGVTAAVAILSAASGAAQHAGHQMPGQEAPPPATAVTDCAQAQPQVLQTIDAATLRLESARQANSPSQMRLALDDLQGALGALRSQLAPCRTLQTSATDPQAGHAMPAPAGPAAAAPDQGARPRPGAGSEQQPAMDHSMMGHDMGASSPESSTDPVCKMTVDAKTAPKAEHNGKTYVFCSESDRQKFLAAPEKYLKTP